MLKAAESLADVHGLSPDHVQPDPAGAMVVLPRGADPRHIDDFSKKPETIYRLVVDGAGVAGAALELTSPDGGTDISRRCNSRTSPASTSSPSSRPRLTS